MKRGNQLDGIDLIFSFFFFFPPRYRLYSSTRKREGGGGILENKFCAFFFFLSCSYNSGRSMFPWNISRGGGTKV